MVDRLLACIFSVRACLVLRCTGGLALVLGVLTIVSPDWIEGLTGLSPDGGNGSLEWLTAIGLLAASGLALLGAQLIAHTIRAARDVLQSPDALGNGGASR